MISKKPKYRVLWTWDYSTFWDDSYYIRGRGAFGENKRRAYFLQDYKRMVDYSAEHGYNGIIIWGALRAHNNGEEQFRELVKYGRQKGVRILPGVGIFGYGGIYYDTRKNYDGWIDIPMDPHPYSLHSWLHDHPELAAVGPDKKPYKTGMFSDIACPSKRENIEWFKRALEWLFTEFEVEGAQIEIGDYSVCHCDDCEKKRKGAKDSVFMVDDMIEPYTIACDIAHKINPDAWIICETYSSFARSTARDVFPGFGSTLSESQKRLLTALPEDAILEWAMDRAVGFEPTQDWTSDVYVPLKNNISRIHAGSQHPLNSIDEWAIHTIGDMVKKARLSGINGVSIFGEESPVSPPNEANYLVFSEFSGFGNPNPHCDLELFYTQTLDPLYGGSGFAKEWERIYVTAHTMRLSEKLLSPAAADPFLFHPVHLAIGRPDLISTVRNSSARDRQLAALQLAQEAHTISSTLSGEACRRWSWLENWLWRAEFLHGTNRWE